MVQLNHQMNLLHSHLYSCKVYHILFESLHSFPGATVIQPTDSLLGGVGAMLEDRCKLFFLLVQCSRYEKLSHLKSTQDSSTRRCEWNDAAQELQAVL